MSSSISLGQGLACGLVASASSPRPLMILAAMAGGAIRGSSSIEVADRGVREPAPRPAQSSLLSSLKAMRFKTDLEDYVDEGEATASKN